jgi:hypothetical protein
VAEDAVARTQIEGLGLRVSACEGDCLRLSDDMAECKAHEETLRGKLWDKLNRLEVDLARTSVKIALIVGVVAAVGSAVLSAYISWLMK